MSSVKVLEKRLKQGLEQGDYYVAEQACSTLYHRLTQTRGPKPPVQADLDRALEIILNGAKELLLRNQPQAGTSLALLAVKHHCDHAIPATPANIARIAALCDLYSPSNLSIAAASISSSSSSSSTTAAASTPTAHTAPRQPAEEARKEQLRLIKAAIKWTQLPSCAGKQHGDPALNARAGRAAHAIRDFQAAQLFFIHSDAPADFAAALHDWVTSAAVPSERDVFLARAVLLYLVDENLADANTLRTTFATLSGWPTAVRAADVSAVPPLGNFCELLLLACQFGERAQVLFNRIRTVYEPALKVDDELPKMMDVVGTKYFGMRAPSTGGMASMMQSMLRGMMGPS